MSVAIVTQLRNNLIIQVDNFRGRYYDFLHNVDTFSFVSSKTVNVESENKKFGLPYQRTNYRTMNSLFRHIVWSNDATFVDCGCGKGLPLLTAAKYRFKRIIGVEYSSDLVSIARKNVSRFRGPLASKDRIEIIHCDATQFEFPITPLVCYFYNPFQAAVMEKVLDNLAVSLQQCPRQVTLVFHIRYPKGLVESRFNLLQCEQVPYFHVYHVAPAKQDQERNLDGGVLWELVDTDQ